MQIVFKKKFAWIVIDIISRENKENVSKCCLLKFYPASKVLRSYGEY